MKVLYLLSRIEKSGVTLHTLDLAQGIVEKGHEVVMITGGITDNKNEYLVNILNSFRDLGIEIRIFKTPKGNIAKKIITSILSVFQILKWISVVKADVIHSQSPYMTFLPWLFGKKYVTTVHNVQLVKNIKYKNPTRLIAISRESKDFAIQKLGASEDKIDIIFHGVSERYAILTSKDQQTLLKITYGIPKESVVIGYVGRITKDKGLDVLINSIKKHLSLSIREKIHLVFLGDYWLKDDEQWLLREISESGFSKQITVISFQDPKPFYNIFDIFVLPSRWEAFGLVAVEAMMSSCCTVRSDTNGALDQIIHGEDGFIFENGNSYALAQILEQAVQNSVLRSTIAGKGKIKAISNFTIDAMTAKTIETYKKLVKLNF